MHATRIRPITIDDAPAVAGLIAATHPNLWVTAAGIQTWMATTPERARYRRWAVEDSGVLVGWANAGLNPETTERHAATAGVMVHPTCRRRGLGTSLWDEVEAHLRDLDARHVTTMGADAEASRRFMASRGFDVASVDRTSGLDPRTLPPPPAPPVGVELRRFAAIDDPRIVFELDVEAVRDIPTDQPWDAIRFDEWLERTWRYPDTDRDASLVAFVRGQPAGFTILLIDHEKSLAVSAMTGVSRRFRGRGLSELLKRHSLACAAAHGVTTALTDNDESNAPMLAVNGKLGYEPVATRLVFSRRSHVV
jgi:GNAT superfamily N-acetyltransferase